MSQNQSLQGKRVAILATDGFEQCELTSPRQYLSDAGASVDVIAPKQGHIKGWDMTDWGDDIAVDKALSAASVADYDALVLPGGLFNPDSLRQNQEAVNLVRAFAEAGKPVAAICHGPWLLAEADIISNRQLTSYPSIQTDIRNAGGYWVDEEVVVDRGIITSRKPGDLDAFNSAIANSLS